MLELFNLVAHLAAAVQLLRKLEQLLKVVPRLLGTQLHRVIASALVKSQANSFDLVRVLERIRRRVRSHQLFGRLQDLCRALRQISDGFLGLELQLELVVSEAFQVQVDLVFDWDLVPGLQPLNHLILRLLKQI